ncbi:hypothetical protein L1987_43985 [Smallanthus sonchifolius]|uniref:Uncharacterized protein n=1 Tax=Smallanthus sonchifolius TaxID=185202 RepID=A0ACB9GNA3_9ASTR|nr:hypothetical protein L1987_43985 [Smallanthus sonchifolius]
MVWWSKRCDCSGFSVVVVLFALMILGPEDRWSPSITASPSTTNAAYSSCFLLCGSTEAMMTKGRIGMLAWQNGGSSSWFPHLRTPCSQSQSDIQIGASVVSIDGLMRVIFSC